MSTENKPPLRSVYSTNRASTDCVYYAIYKILALAQGFAAWFLNLQISRSDLISYEPETDWYNVKVEESAMR